MFQLTIKPMGPQPAFMENMLTESITPHPQLINNINVPLREGSPQYMVASADGTETIPQRSGKKRRRYTPNLIDFY